MVAPWALPGRVAIANPAVKAKHANRARLLVTRRGTKPELPYRRGILKTRTHLPVVDLPSVARFR